jgi:hypothetical protein
MENDVQYIIDEKGDKTSVIVPYKKWEEMLLSYKKLQNKVNVFQSIQNGFNEIKTKDREDFQTLSEFFK